MQVEYCIIAYLLIAVLMSARITDRNSNEHWSWCALGGLVWPAVIVVSYFFSDWGSYYLVSCITINTMGR